MNCYSSQSKTIELKPAEGKKYYSELIISPNKLLKGDSKLRAVADIRTLISDNWGDFGEDFILRHIFSSALLLVLRDTNDNTIGFATISEKMIARKKVYYLEFTVIDKKHNGLGLSQIANSILARHIFIRDILKGKFSFDLMVITPNMRVLGTLARKASFIYPNPYSFDPISKKIEPADDESWEMAKELISGSDNPKRKILREGNVLLDSYKETPHLVYEPDFVPKHHQDLVNEFGETYLEYSKRSGKEFIVRARFNLKDIFKELLMK